MISFVAMLMAEATSADRYRTPEATAAAISYLKAIECASDKAAATKFDEPTVDRLTKTIDERCLPEREEAIRSLMKTLGGTEDLARGHIIAKMHIAANGVLIKRLEDGERPPVDLDDPLQLNDFAAAYISCLRISLNRKMEGIHLGEEWILGFRGMTSQDIFNNFSQFAQSECPKTTISYNSAFKASIDSEKDKSLKDLITRNYSPNEITNFAIKSYVSVVPVDN